MVRITDLYTLNDAQLADLLAQIAQKVALDPGSFGLNEDIAGSMTQAAGKFEARLNDWNQAKVAASAALSDRVEQRKQSMATISEYLQLMYASPEVSDAKIASLGLVPRKPKRRVVIPAQPKDFHAIPNANGTVKLKWKRGEQRQVVQFEIFAAASPDGVWKMVGVTKKISYVVPNVVPGTPMVFRIRASKKGRESAFSNISAVYMPLPRRSSTLKIAS